MDTVWKERVLDVVQDIFREQFFDDSLSLAEDTTPADIEEWDSLAQINLLAAIETRFNIRFTAEDMAAIDSVAGLLKVMQERGAK